MAGIHASGIAARTGASPNSGTTFVPTVSSERRSSYVPEVPTDPHPAVRTKFRKATPPALTASVIETGRAESSPPGNKSSLALDSSAPREVVTSQTRL